MSEDIGKLTSHGLMSIDLATSIIIKNLMLDKDYQAAHKNLEIYCSTIGDKEIIEVCYKHQKETIRYLEMARSHRSYTLADRFSKMGQEDNYLGERCHELWKIIRLLMKDKKYLDWTGPAGRNPNPKHIKDEAGPT
jgi:hypothetical protein